MKRIITTAIFSFGLICMMLFSSGCTNKKYEFYGILDDDNLTIIPYTDIADETVKESVSIYENSFIDLNSDKTYEFTYYISSNPSELITYTQNGTYTLEEGKLRLQYEKEEGKMVTNLQQYIEGKVIYYNSEYFLVYV